jgi:hypothetical protein
MKGGYMRAVFSGWLVAVIGGLVYMFVIALMGR